MAPQIKQTRHGTFLNKYRITSGLCNTYPRRTLVPPPNVQLLSPALLGPRVKIDIFPNGLLYGENSIKLVHFWEQNKVVAFASAVQKKNWPNTYDASAYLPSGRQAPKTWVTKSQPENKRLQFASYFFSQQNPQFHRQLVYISHI